MNIVDAIRAAHGIATSLSGDPKSVGEAYPRLRWWSGRDGHGSAIEVAPLLTLEEVEAAVAAYEAPAETKPEAEALVAALIKKGVVTRQEIDAEKAARIEALR